MGGGGLVAKQLALHQPVVLVKLSQVALAKLLFLFTPRTQFYYFCDILAAMIIQGSIFVPKPNFKLT